MQKIDLKPIFERIKYNALDYIGVYEAPAEELSLVLASVAEEYGADIFLEPAALQQALAEAGLEPAENHRVCLMTHVTGFRSLVLIDERTVQNNLDRYVQNAVRETGFNRETVLRLTGSIVYAMGGKMDLRSGKGNKTQIRGDAVVAMAHTVYHQQLADFGSKLDIIRTAIRLENEGAGERKLAVAKAEAERQTLDFSMLQPLVDLGIPKAKFYLGYCLMEGIQLEANWEQGMALLEEAADEGDSEAAGLLGDYHFEMGGSNHWTKAYEYYTGYGALALNDDRRNAIASILNHKLFNRKMLAWSIALFLALVATVIWVPGGGLFAGRLFWGWFAVVIQLGLLVVTIMHYRTKPYDSVYRLPVAMALVWVLYMLIRLWF